MPRKDVVAWFALSGWKVRGAEITTAGACRCSATNSGRFVRHHRQDRLHRRRGRAVFAAALGLLDPYVTCLLRLDVEAQVAALPDDLATDARRPVDVDQHELATGVRV